MPNLTDEQRDKLREIGRLMKEVSFEIDVYDTCTQIYIGKNKLYDSRKELFEINGNDLIKIADSDKGE